MSDIFAKTYDKNTGYGRIGVYWYRDEIIYGFVCTLYTIIQMLSLMAWYTMSESPVPAMIVKYIRYVCYALCMVAVLDKLRTRKFFGVACVLGFLLTVGSMYAGNKNILYIVLFILAAYNVRSEWVIKFNFCIKTFMLLATVLLAKCGVLLNYIFANRGADRQGLGFAWATYAPIMFFFIALEYMYLRKGKMKFAEYLVLEGINVWFYMMTNTTMTFGVLTLAIVLFAICSNSEAIVRFTLRLKGLIISSPFIIAVFSICIHAAYKGESDFWVKLNSFLHDRLRLGFNGIREYGITLWGQSIKWIGNGLYTRPDVKYNYVDCAYLQMLLQYGIIILAVVLALYSIIIYKAYKAKEYGLIWIIVFSLLLCITEPRLMVLIFNPFPMLAFGRFDCCDESDRFRALAPGYVQGFCSFHRRSMWNTRIPMKLMLKRL